MGENAIGGATRQNEGAWVAEGNSDELMSEGCSGEAAAAADILVRSPLDALDLPLNTNRPIATLRRGLPSQRYLRQAVLLAREVEMEQSTSDGDQLPALSRRRRSFNQQRRHQ